MGGHWTTLLEPELERISFSPKKKSELPELQCMRNGQDQQTLPLSLHVVMYTFSLARHGKLDCTSS